MDFLTEVDIESLVEDIDIVETLEIDDNSPKGTIGHDANRHEFGGLPNRSPGALSSSPPTNTPLHPPSTKKKRKYQRGYSTKLLHRKKTELCQLRKEEQNLQAWLDHLKIVVSNTKLSSKQEESSEQKSTRHDEWIAIALDEFKKRQRAEAVNRRLKAIQANQVKVQESLLEIIQHEPTLEDKFFVSDPVTPRRSVKICEAHENTLIIGELKDKTNSLFQKVKELVPQQQSDQFSSSLVAKFDPKRGKLFESSTVSFVSCSTKDAGDVLWIEYSTRREVAYNSYRYMNMVDKTSVKKSFDLLLHSQRGCMSINGLMFAQKFEQTEQVTMIRSYVVLLPTAGLHIRCNHWTIITPSSHGCFVRFFVQLYTETRDGFTATPEDVEYVQEVALAAWSTKMHFYSKILLDLLVDKAFDSIKTEDTY